MNPDLADALQALVAVAIESTVGLEDHTNQLLWLMPCALVLLNCSALLSNSKTAIWIDDLQHSAGLAFTWAVW